MSVETCAQIVRKSDPDRFFATMTAAPDQRAKLFAIYAFNVEVAHLPWVSGEPLIAEMRLQWWQDSIEAMFNEATVLQHEVITVLAQVVRECGLNKPDFTELIAARRWDIYSDPFQDLADMQNYLKATSGNLMAIAGQALGIDPPAVEAARDYGAAAGLAGFLQAVPELTSRGRVPLPDAGSDFLRGLAKEALIRMDQARGNRALLPALPALLAGAQARPILKLVVKQPERVAAGRLGRSEFRRKGRLLVQSMLRRW